MIAAVAASTGIRPALAAGSANTPVETLDVLVDHPSPPVDHPLHRGVNSFHPDGTVRGTSPHGVAPGSWRWVGLNTFELIIDEYEYDRVDASLQVILHCTVTFVSADRITGTCTAALISPDGVRIALVPGNAIDGVRLQLPTDYYRQDCVG